MMLGCFRFLDHHLFRYPNLAFDDVQIAAEFELFKHTTILHMKLSSFALVFLTRHEEQ